MTLFKYKTILVMVLATMTTLAVAQTDTGRPAVGLSDDPPVNKPLKPGPGAPPAVPPMPPTGEMPSEEGSLKEPPLRKVDLKSAGFFVILAKSGISTVPASAITGNIGVSPITGKAMTGFAMSTDSSGRFETSDQITGRAYGADSKLPTPSMLTVAVGDMETAYTDAASRTVSGGANLNVMGGLIAGTTFKAGVYTWGTGINFSSDIYIKGDDKDVFIFQSSGNIIAGTGAKVILIPDVPGGPVPDPANIVWQNAGYLDAGTGSHLEGIFLVKTHAVLKTNASMNGRIFSQTACTLDSATVVKPST
jgi:hypothetical protein